MNFIVVFLIFIITFAVRDIPQNNEAHSIYKAVNNPQGWHTGESPAVLPELRFGVSRSDHLSFFNSQIHTVMRDTDGLDAEMLSMLGTIRANHPRTRPETILSLLERDKLKLVNDFIVEMDAKNEAYYFIIKCGLMLAFRDYCLKQVSENRRTAVY